MVEVHPTALVDPAAELGGDVVVGPFCIVEAGARIGDRCRLAARVVVHTNTTIGADCTIDVGAVLGGLAQDFKCNSTDTYLEVGHGNVIREFVTMHRSNHEGGTTRVGNESLFMANTHIGHDAVIGNHVNFANLVTIAGHVQVDDRAVIGGLVGVHQRARIGEYAMVGGMSGANMDVPPYCMAEGKPARIRGLNVIGLRRSGFDAATRDGLRAAVRMLFMEGRHRGRALDEVEQSLPTSEPLQRLLAFVRASREGRNGRQLER